MLRRFGFGGGRRVGVTGGTALFDQLRLIANRENDFVVVIQEACGDYFTFRRVGVAAERTDRAAIESPSADGEIGLSRFAFRRRNLDARTYVSD